MAIYRNHTPTLSQIQALGNIRITTAQEAVAFLRALAPLNEQVSYVLQRSSLREQQVKNITTAQMRADMEAEAKQTTTTSTPTQTIVEPVSDKAFVPEDLSSDEGFSETEVEEKVAKLKKARRKKES